MPVNNPHYETAHQVLDQLKEYASTLEGWNLSQTKNGVKLYSKTIPGSPFTVLRGEADIEGHEYTPQQIVSIAATPGCRKIWDDKYDTSEVKQMYNKFETLFWSKAKVPWPISPRDICAVSLHEINPDECYLVLTSVKDASIPEIAGSVRSNLFMSGWKVSKTDTGIHITYITQIDLAGSIPTAFIKSVQLQVPLCAGSVIRYAKEFGFVPNVFTDYTAEFIQEDFDHKTKVYTSQLNAGEEGRGEVKWLISRKMYPNGVKVEVSGTGTSEVFEDNGSMIAVVKGIEGITNVKISKA